MEANQMNELRRATADAYRKKHILLTSREIIALREKLNMSQVEFARYLNRESVRGRCRADEKRFQGAHRPCRPKNRRKYTAGRYL